MYLYDLEANFNSKFYDYFDWNKNDKIVFIKRIPILKTKDVENIIHNKVVFEKEVLKEILNKTKTNDSTESYKYACVLSDATKSVIVLMDESGNLRKISDIFLLDEIELGNFIHKMKVPEISYKIIKKMKQLFFTRKELEIKKFLNNKLSTKTDQQQLEYLYLECFNKKEKNVPKILKELQNLLNKDWEENYLKIYNFFKVTM